MRAALAGCVLVMLGGGLAGAQVRARPTLRIDRLDARKPPALQLYVSDLDSTGAAITDRERKKYRLLVDGVPQSSPSKTRRFGELNEPLAVTLVLQVSPTLRDVLTEAVEGGKRFVDALPPGSKVGLVAFTDVVVQDLRPAAPAEVKRALDDLRIRDEAVEIQLPDAIRDGLEGLTQLKGPEARALVVLSDGLTANLDFAVFAELGARAKDKGVSVHSIGYAPLEPARLRTLFELSRTGAGAFREAKDPPAVVQAFDAVGDQLLNQQVLTFTLPKIFDGKLHDFQLEIGEEQGSNIVSAELPAFTATDEAAPGRRAAWLVFAVIAVLLIGGTVGTWLVLRWREARAAPPRPALARATEHEDDDEDEDEDQDQAGSGREPGLGDEDEDQVPPGRRRSSSPPALAALQAPADAAAGAGPRALQASEQSRARPLPGAPPTAFDPGAARRNIDLLFAAGDRSMERRIGSAPLAAPPAAPAASPVSDFGAAAQGSPAAWGSTPALVPNSGLLVLAPPGAAPPPPEALPPGAFALSPGGAPDGGPAAFRLPLPDPDGLGGPPLAERGHGPALRLPDPEDYLRRVAQPSAPPQPIQPSALPEPARFAPTQPVPSFAYAPNPPPPAPAPAPAGPAPFLPVQPLAAEIVEPGRMIDRKTAVLAVEQIADVDFSAWIVALGEPSLRTVVVGNGFRLADDPRADLRLQPDDAPGLEGTICLDSRGYRIELRGAQGQVLAQPLNDGDSFEIGARRFLFKIATRFPQRQLAAARLEVLSGLDQGRSLGLRDGVACALGCHPSCAFVIRGEGVGERHAVVLRKDKGCIVADLGAEGGVWYQGQRIGQQTVMPGEEFAVGTVRLLYIVEA